MQLQTDISYQVYSGTLVTPRLFSLGIQKSFFSQAIDLRDSSQRKVFHSKTIEGLSGQIALDFFQSVGQYLDPTIELVPSIVYPATFTRIPLQSTNLSSTDYVWGEERNLLESLVEVYLRSFNTGRMYKLSA